MARAPKQCTGLGNLKDRYFTEHWNRRCRSLRSENLTGFVSFESMRSKLPFVLFSNNCAAVLQAAGIAQLFDTRVWTRTISLVLLSTASLRPMLFCSAAARGRTVSRRGSSNNSTPQHGSSRFRRAGTFLLKNQKILQRYTIRNYVWRTPCPMLLTPDTEVQKNRRTW